MYLLNTGQKKINSKKMVKINAYPNFFLIRLLQRDLQETKL